MEMLDQKKKLRSATLCLPRVPRPLKRPAFSQPSCRKTAAHALTIVRDGVITGEGPTTKGRIHFSRALDADDAAWCARILTATAVEHQPVSRAEAEALFEISDAAAERTDDGRFDDLLAKAVAHHAASESGLPVPPRTVALSPDTEIESWAPAQAIKIDTEVLEWIASQMRGKRRSNHTPDGDGRERHRRRRAAAGAVAGRVRHRDDVRSSESSLFRTAGAIFPPFRFSLAMFPFWEHIGSMRIIAWSVLASFAEKHPETKVPLAAGGLW